MFWYTLETLRREKPMNKHTVMHKPEDSENPWHIVDPKGKPSGRFPEKHLAEYNAERLSYEKVKQ
jgi:hypothetical protein